MTEEEYLLNPTYCKCCGKILPYEKRNGKILQ